MIITANNRSKKIQQIDIITLLALPLIATVISFSYYPSFFASILLFLGLPALFVSCRAPRYILKSALFSLLASIPLMVILEYIGGHSSAWSFPPSVFPYLVLGRVSIEVLLWAFLNIYAVVIFYEYLFDNHKIVTVWKKQMWTLVKYLIVWILLFIFLLIFYKTIAIPYFYLLFGLVLFIFPVFMSWWQYPRILPKVAYACGYFFYLSLLYELTALSLGWWSFPGSQFLGWISIGNLRFPIEEFVFWIILFAPAVICAFEYLDDDRK